MRVTGFVCLWVDCIYVLFLCGSKLFLIFHHFYISRFQRDSMVFSPNFDPFSDVVDDTHTLKSKKVCFCFKTFNLPLPWICLLKFFRKRPDYFVRFLNSPPKKRYIVRRFAFCSFNVKHIIYFKGVNLLHFNFYQPATEKIDIF